MCIFCFIVLCPYLVGIRARLTLENKLTLCFLYQTILRSITVSLKQWWKNYGMLKESWYLAFLYLLFLWCDLRICLSVLFEDIPMSTTILGPQIFTFILSNYIILYFWNSLFIEGLVDTFSCKLSWLICALMWLLVWQLEKHCCCFL